MDLRALDNPIIVGNEHQFVPIANSCIYKHSVKDDRFNEDLILSIHRSSPSHIVVPVNGVCWTLRSNAVSLKRGEFTELCKIVIEHAKQFCIENDIDVKSVISNYPCLNIVIQKGEEVQVQGVPYQTHLTRTVFNCQMGPYFKMVSRDVLISEVLYG